METETTQQTNSDNAYIKLIKNTKGFNFEIKVYSNTTKEQMEKIRAIIDENHEYMETKYGSSLL